MNINDIFTEIEYTKERSTRELFELVKQKEKELRVWSEEHSGTKTLREMKYREFNKGLPNKFAHELTPFAYYANTYYGNKPRVRFKPCCGSEQYDGIIANNNEEIFVEVTNAIDGEKWGLQKELLVENGYSPWEYNIHGVEGDKTKRNRSASDIITSNECANHTDVIRNTKQLVKDTANNKCKMSMEQKLPYGKDKTILIVTFDDTGFSENDRSDFVNFKQAEIDSMEHNFIKIILFGWISKKFIPENL
ncbi:MAG: hypothetical protein FVQ85_12850 [Planctomycetes bacterium]|nr:hypothetical protein [Planctomycetota bacterium]